MSSFFVFDTNTIVSAAVIPDSTPRKALDKAIGLGMIALSNNTLIELIEVLFRRKFDKYFVNNEERWSIINKIEVNSKIFIPNLSITDCRDPKDNKFLELAVAADASCIITGNKDLLVLHPFRNISILNAVDFINIF